MQFFKGDETELKFFNSASPTLEEISAELDLFFTGAYSCFALGDIIWDSKRSPLANAIPRRIFREAYTDIFDTFLESGSFEGYISVFKRIFGEDVDVEFTVPDPGKLTIDIETTGVVLYDYITRYIEDNEYVFDEIIDDQGDNIALRSVKGFENPYELNQMLFEMVPSGIFTDINLTIGA